MSLKQSTRTRTPARSWRGGSGALPYHGVFCLTLLRMGFTKLGTSPHPLVVSYTTVSPLPPQAGTAVCFLWHWPAGYPEWTLSTILCCGARTFLEAHTS